MKAAADAEAEMKAATESDAEAAAAVAFLSSIHFNNTLSKYYRDWGSVALIGGKGPGWSDSPTHTSLPSYFPPSPPTSHVGGPGIYFFPLDLPSPFCDHLDRTDLIYRCRSPLLLPLPPQSCPPYL